MKIGTVDALGAYARVGGLAPAASSPAARPFGGLVEQMVSDTGDALKGAEQAAARQVAGKGDLIDVVTAMGAAEMAIDKVVAVRDRVIGAYSEIMRMQI